MPDHVALRARGERLMQAGAFQEAEPVLRKALSASQRAFGPASPEAAASLTRLAACCQSLGRFAEAGPLYQRALAIAERAQGRSGVEVAAIYHELAALEHAAGNWARGVPFARTALRLRRRVLGPRHPHVAGDMVALAALLDGQEDRDEAERLYARAIAIFEREADVRRAELAVAVNNLAAIRQAQKRRAEAESLYRRALALNIARLGERHPQVAFCANNLGVLLTERGRAPEAARLLRTAVAMFHRAFGPRSPNVGRCLENYAEALRALGRRREASVIDRRAERILSRMETLSDEGAAATATINPERTRFQLIVGPSAISRLGVFAEEPIPARRRVIEYTGERIDRREARRRSSMTRTYLFAADEYCLDGAIGGSGAEYVNHSCAPNLEARVVGGRILYYSLSEIGPGEELTIDYRYPATIEPVPCRCGATSCRGTINVTRRDDGTPRRRRRASRSRL